MPGEYGTYDFIHRFDKTNIWDPTVASAADIILEVATGDTLFIWTCLWPMEVLAFGYLVTVAFNYDTLVTEGVVALDKRVTYLSDTGRVEVCRIDLETALPLGDVRFVLPNRTNIRCAPGDQLVVEVITAALGGTEVGDWSPFVMCGVWAETPANILNAALVQTWTQSTLAQVV